MAAKIGAHSLRDSFHIIPEKLANFQKDNFDYLKLKRGNREQYRDEIIRYMVSDCKYLLEVVRDFLRRFGFKISIGQAAMYELKKHYTVKRLGERSDEYLRRYFFGGRVECLQGKGRWKGEYKLYDVNSMYPSVMSSYLHPIGNEFLRRSGRPSEDTIFLELECRNYGAFVTRAENNETTAAVREGHFFTTIWEYNVARKYDLIANVKIIGCLDFKERSDFSKFVLPLYSERQVTKARLQTLEAGSREYNEVKRDDIFLKLIQNNAYGKFAQNPRRYRESYLTDQGQRPPAELEGFGDLPVFECPDYAIWERPNPKLTFNNVATAASITGAARAVLLEAIMNAEDAIYCDTDSIICRALNGVDIDKVRLGAWDLETEMTEVIIAGKKLYGYKDAKFPDGHSRQVKIKSKGTAGLTWDGLNALLEGEVLEIMSKAPTITKRGDQYYVRRSVRATATPKHKPLTRKVYRHA